MPLPCILPPLAATLICASTLALSACEVRSGAQASPASPKPARAEAKAIGSYLFLQGGEGHSSFVVSSGAQVDATHQMKARFGKAFIWFIHERKPYVIQDEATLAKARGLFNEDASFEEGDRQLEARESQLETQRKELEARRDTLDSARERLDEQEEALDEKPSPSAEARGRLDRERQVLDRDSRALDRAMDQLDQAEEKLDKERQALFAQQEKRMEAAEGKLLRLMLEAVKSGLARPVADKMKAS